MDRNKNEAFLKALNGWIKKSRQEEISNQFISSINHNSNYSAKKINEEKSEMENIAFKYNQSIKKRNEVMIAYENYTAAVSDEIANIYLSELQKRLVEFFSYACYDKAITDNYGEYFSIFYNQLLKNIKKIPFRDFKPDYGKDKDYADKTWTIIEYTKDIIVKKHHNKAVKAEIIKDHSLSQPRTEKGKPLAISTWLNHRKIADKAKEICKSLGWNEKNVYLDDEKLEYIFRIIKDKSPSEKVHKRSLDGLKDIMLEDTLNILTSYDQLLSAAISNTKNGELNDDSCRDDKFIIDDFFEDAPDYHRRLNDILNWVVGKDKHGDNDKRPKEKQVTKFALHIIYQYFEQLYIINADILSLSDIIELIGNSYQYLSSDNPLFFKNEYYSALVNWVKENNDFPSKEKYCSYCCGYSNANVIKGYKDIVNSDAFIQRFGQQKL